MPKDRFGRLRWCRQEFALPVGLVSACWMAQMPLWHEVCSGSGSRLIAAQSVVNGQLSGGGGAECLVGCALR